MGVGGGKGNADGKAEQVGFWMHCSVVLRGHEMAFTRQPGWNFTAKRGQAGAGGTDPSRCPGSGVRWDVHRAA